MRPNTPNVPTVGQIVHIHMPSNSEYEANELAALIVNINWNPDEPIVESVDLCVFGHEGFGWRRNVKRGYELGQWEYPEIAH